MGCIFTNSDAAAAAATLALFRFMRSIPLSNANAFSVADNLLLLARRLAQIKVTGQGTPV